MCLPTTALLLGLLAVRPPLESRSIETPGGGVQPQAVVDAEGVIHLVFLRGKADGSDVFYSSRKPGESAFGPRSGSTPSRHAPSRWGRSEGPDRGRPRGAGPHRLERHARGRSRPIRSPAPPCSTPGPMSNEPSSSPSATS